MGIFAFYSEKKFSKKRDLLALKALMKNFNTLISTKIYFNDVVLFLQKYFDDHEDLLNENTGLAR